MKVKRILCVVIAVLMVMSLAACGQKTTNNQPASDGETGKVKLDAHWYDSDGFVHVNLATTVATATMEPLASVTGVTTWCLQDMIYDHIIVENADGTYSPGLATEWSVSEDGKTWTLKLREGVKFSNGTDFNADDVAATMQRYMDKKGTELAVSAPWSFLTGYEVIDPYTISVSFSDPYGTILNSWSLVSVLSAEDYAELGDEYFTRAYCIGAGKWKVDEFKENQSVTMSLNPYYWGGVDDTNVEKVTLHFVADNSAMVTGLISGAFDVAVRVSNDLLPMLASNQEIEVIPFQSTCNMQIGLQCADGSPFHDEKVRQAFSYCIDRQTICDVILPGSTPSSQYLPAGVIGHDDSLPVVYDPTLAKQLLEESSYDGSEIVIMPMNYLEAVDDVFTKITEDCKAIGLNATYSKIDAASWGAVRNAGEFIAYGHNDNINVDNGGMLYVRYSNPGQNHHFEDDAVQALITELYTELDTARRQELLTEINKAFYDASGPVVPVYTYTFNHCVRDGLEGYNFTGLGGYLYRDIRVAE